MWQSRCRKSQKMILNHCSCWRWKILYDTCTMTHVSVCEGASVCDLLPVWPSPVSPRRGGAAQSFSPVGGEDVCEQPPCPPSSCHITIRSCSRTANYVCVWQPHRQGGEKTAGRWRMEGGGGGWRRRRVNCLLSCERMSVSVRHGEEGNFVVTPAWFHCERESGCLSSHLLPSLSFHD